MNERPKAPAAPPPASLDDDDGSESTSEYDRRRLTEAIDELSDVSELPAVPDLPSDLGDPEPSTDPRQRVSRASVTGRMRLVSDMGDELSQIPSAHVSVFDVSDLDGDVEEGGGGEATTVMKLPPDMLPDPESVEMLRWKTGPKPSANVPPTLDDDANIDADALGATIPALSLDAVRRAAAEAGIALPNAASDDSDDKSDFSEDTRGDSASIAQAIEGALAAIISAQACADGATVPKALHDHLARAVEVLSLALERLDD